MAGKFVSTRNLKFLLHEVFDAEALTRSAYFGQHNRKTFDMVLDAAMKLSAKLLWPIHTEMDRHPPTFSDGKVKAHPAVPRIMAEFGRGGWIAATFPETLDGEQLPSLVNAACSFIFSAANYSASVYPLLTGGAARLIANFGADDLKKTYLDKMLSGRWQGTMALTEPQAGSSLTDIMTTAVPTGNAGEYRLRGQKVFISAGDHDGTENIVHLMLARIEGAPAGVKGISLFVVPKKRGDGSGGLVPNDVTCTQIFHKLGYRGAPITELSIGDRNDCAGYLVGEPHQGLGYMFQLMNEARIGVGIGAAGIASAAYLAALDYCRQRTQGRPPANKDPAAPQVPIITHPDVKRMLMFQRAVVEGSASLLMQCARYEDMGRIADGAQLERSKLLLDLLTPVAKTYPSEMGVLSTSQSIQCFGGYGYCEDFPVEQCLRDIRIHPIHEGTTGIQAMDLLGRKVVMKDGRAFALFIDDVGKATAAAAGMGELAPLAGRLDAALGTLESVTGHLVGLVPEKGIEVFLADATLYLELFGTVAIAWQWLLQATVAQKALGHGSPAGGSDFYTGKIMTAEYFFAYELPKINGLAERLTDGNPLTVRMSEHLFGD